jgi:hypothetical protein
MKLINQGRPSLPIEKYSIALLKAIAGLDERYVLGLPVKPRMTTIILLREPRMEQAPRDWYKKCRCDVRKRAALNQLSDELFGQVVA